MTALEHDSQDWRTQRNAKLVEWIRDPAAVAWVLDYFQACEVFDDLIDKDKPVTEDDIIGLLWTTLVDYAGNPFFLAHAGTLIPVVHMGISTWLDANEMERKGTDDALDFSYVLRDAYTGILQTVVELSRGREAMRACSLEMWEFFQTETKEEYVRKLKGRGQ